MNTIRKALFPVIGAAAFFAFANVASASTYTSLGTCDVTDMTATADECFGAIQENENDSESVLNNGTFGTDSGLFGYTDWDFLAKYDVDENELSGENIGLSVTGGSTSGSWEVNTGALDAFKRIVIILKATNSFAAYLYEPGSNAGDGGAWATNAFTNQNGKVQALSHFSIYTSDFEDPTGGVIPLPAGLPLILSALGLTGLLRLRQRKSA